MARIIVLDTGPAGRACDNPKKSSVAEIQQWIFSFRQIRTLIVLPESVAYELRRNLLLSPGGDASCRRLDDLTVRGGPLIYLPLTTPAMRMAAELWAEARRSGLGTSDPKALDGDVILAAQALCYVGQGDQLWIATENQAHLSRYIGERARFWDQIHP